MINIKDREVVLKIAKDWEKSGIVVVATCKNKKCKNQSLVFLTTGENKVGYSCPNCRRTWVWGITYIGKWSLNND